MTEVQGAHFGPLIVIVAKFHITPFRTRALQGRFLKIKNERGISSNEDEDQKTEKF
jgi:hypothetical protein